MYQTSVCVISLVVVVISYVNLTSLPAKVWGLSRRNCWYGRETTWKGDDAATYKYVIPGDIQLVRSVCYIIIIIIIVTSGNIEVCDTWGHTVRINCDTWGHKGM